MATAMIETHAPRATYPTRSTIEARATRGRTRAEIREIAARRRLLMYAMREAGYQLADIATICNVGVSFVSQELSRMRTQRSA